MRIEKKMETAGDRSKLIRTIRRFFDSRGHTEVETPVLSRQCIPESVIRTFATVYTDPYRDHIPLRLLPSPEIWMKRLLSEGSGSIYQLSKCFRNAESVGPFHNPEFTMLEWYTVGADYSDSMNMTEELLKEIASAFPRCDRIKKWLPAEKMTVSETFSKYAGRDLSSEAAAALRHASAVSPAGPNASGRNTQKEEPWEAWFNRVFLTEVEPNLPADKALFLADYPAAVPCLAKPVTGTPWLERWELYIEGAEIANCFTEERSEERVREFMARELAEIPEELRGEVPEDFPAVCAAMPPCSGVALGIDRLLMAVTGAKKLEEVLMFPFASFFHL